MYRWRRQRVHTLLLCKARMTLRLAVLVARLELNRSSSEKGLSALHIFWHCCSNEREMS